MLFRMAVSSRGAGLSIHVIGSGPADSLKGFAGFHILDGKLGVFGDDLGHVVFKPVQRFGRVLLDSLLTLVELLLLEEEDVVPNRTRMVAAPAMPSAFMERFF